MTCCETQQSRPAAGRGTTLRTESCRQKKGGKPKPPALWVECCERRLLGGVGLGFTASVGAQLLELVLLFGGENGGDFVHL